MMDCSRATYDPRTLFILSDRSAFSRRVPFVIRQTASVPPLQTGSASVNAAFAQMRDTCQKFILEGPDTVNYGLFNEFRAQNGLTQPLNRDPIIITEKFDRTPRPYDIHKAHGFITGKLLEFGGDWDSKWAVFLGTASIPREKAVTPVKNILRLLHDLPSVRYLPDSSCSLLLDAITNASYQFTLSIFPDLTDVEAKALFGQLTTADFVREHAQLPELE